MSTSNYWLFPTFFCWKLSDISKCSQSAIIIDNDIWMSWSSFRGKRSVNAHEVETNKTELATQIAARHEGSLLYLCYSLNLSLCCPCSVAWWQQTFECSPLKGDRNFSRMSMENALRECFSGESQMTVFEFMKNFVKKSAMPHQQHQFLLNFTFWHINLYEFTPKRSIFSIIKFSSFQNATFSFQKATFF